MLIRLLRIFIIIYFLIFSIFTGKGFAIEAETPYFSNEDIEKYKKPSDASDDKSPDIKVDRAERKKETVEEKKEGQQKEYWCKKAAQHNKKIEMAQDEVKEKDKELSDLKDALFLENSRKRKAGERNIKQAQKKLDDAKKKLKYAERDMTDLEDEARRKEVPPGWLRCQFE